LLDHLPYEHRFKTIYECDNGGCVRVHVDYKPKSDAHILLIIAREKAEKGHFLELIPELSWNQLELRVTTLPGVIGLKNPDLRINGKYVEVKELQSNSDNTISKRIKKANKQARHIILDLPGERAEFELYKIAKGKFRIMKKVEVLEFRYQGKYYSFTRDIFEK
jgi:hypothetical protein